MRIPARNLRRSHYIKDSDLSLRGRITRVLSSGEGKVTFILQPPEGSEFEVSLSWEQLVVAEFQGD